MNLSRFKKMAIGFLTLFIIFSFSKSEVGGVLLLMSMEQQKKTERLVNYFEDDLNLFYNTIDTSIYYYNFLNKKKRKKEVVLSQEFKQEVVVLSKDLKQSYVNVIEAFKSIYFADGAADYAKKYFETFKFLISSLDNINDEFDSDYLLDVQCQASEALVNLTEVQKHIRKARLANSEEIKKKAKEMTVWQWLFG